MNSTGIKDLPILTSKDETLGVLPYIESLSEFILSCDTPMTISIQGDWGSGKTSVMNMIKEQIEDKVIPVWFNTWQFSQFQMHNELSLSLISYFVEELDDRDYGIKKKINGVLKGLGKMAIAVVAEQTLGETVAGKIADSQSEVLDSAKALKNLKTELQKIVQDKIKNSDKDRIVVFLDDLDRLSPEKAVELLEVLKNFLDVEQCVFILAVDYSVVVQGIKKKFNTDMLDEKGRSFFDKIIQLPFNMPVAQYNTEMYCENLLNRINIEYEQKDINTYIGLATYSVGFNPRGLKRIFNLFQLLSIVAKKQAFLDSEYTTKAEKNRMLFSILCLQTAFEPVYNFLVNNLDDLSNDFFKLLMDQEALEKDEQFIDLREKLIHPNQLLYRRIARFIEVFYDALQLNSDSNDKEFSEGEIEQIKNLLSFSSVTSTDISSIEPQLSKSKKSNFGKPIREFIQDVYDKLTATDELTRDQLRQMIYDEIKIVTNDEVRKDTINCQLITSTVNDPSRRHYGVNDINMELTNHFYYVDENNKKGIMKKFIPQNPPKNIKIYFRKKDTKEDSEIILT